MTFEERKAQVKYYLGKDIYIKIERNIKQKHLYFLKRINYSYEKNT